MGGLTTKSTKRYLLFLLISLAICMVGKSQVTSFQLISGTTGKLPFTVGLCFKKGDIPGIPKLNISDSQVIVKRRWNDGSVKHAIASGQAWMTQGEPIVINASAAAMD